MVILNIDIKNDLKPDTCRVVEFIEEKPFVKRCEKTRGIGLKVCMSHCYSVNFMYYVSSEQKYKEMTRYFDTIEEAEEFRTNEPKWIQCNYDPKRALTPCSN